MNRKHKKTLLRITISAILLIAAVITSALLSEECSEWLRLAIFLPSYLVIGYDVLIKAFKNLFGGSAFDENFLMTIATLGALFIGFFPSTESQYPEAVFVMLFYQVGELFQGIAVGKSRRSISELVKLCPETANIEKDGVLSEVDPSEVSVGDTIVVKPGERIPLDGTVLSGSSSIDTSALTGESMPIEATSGDSVMSGCINISGTLKLTVTRVFEDSAVSKILALVESAAANKSKSENFISRFARIYTPAVVISAVLLGLIGPFFGVGGYVQSLPEWIIRALTFLVVSCPCALVISVPLSFFGGIGSASKNGILIKGSNRLEALASVDTLAFDKTGTLTKGTFTVSEIKPFGCNEAELTELCAYAEHYSDHPTARPIKARFTGSIDTSRLENVTELAGKGVSCTFDGKKLLAGNKDLMQMNGITVSEPSDFKTSVHVALDGEYKGCILISDELKPDSENAINNLKLRGIKRLVMLTGDRDAVAREVTEKLGLSEYRASLLPDRKVAAVEELLSENTSGKLAFVGDGINDAPVLMRADVGIAMGAFGSDAAIEASDIVLMDDSLAKIPIAIDIARKTVGIAKQNIVFALSVKIAVLILSAFGLAPMWLAVFADVGVAFIAILNAMRTLKHK